MSTTNFLRDDEQFDDLLRTSLGEMQTEPSAGLWPRLSRKMLRAELLRLRFTNLPKIFWGIIPAAMIITGAGLYFGLSETEPTAGQPVAGNPPNITIEQPVVSTPPIVTLEQPVVTTPPDVTFDRTTVTSLSGAKASMNNPSLQKTKPGAENAEAVDLVSSPGIAAASGSAGPENLNVIEEEPAPRANLPEIVSVRSLQDESLLSTTDITPVIRWVSNPVPEETSLKPNRPPLPRWLDLGINITPDLVFYNQTGGSFKYNYTFDLGARYSIGRLYLQSGAGLTYSTDIGDYAISYLKNDSIGYYYTINSFSVEPGNPEDPQFEAKQVTVYDSVQYLHDYSTKNHYTYLQIPLGFGYRIINKPVWRLSAEAGLVYSYLLSVDEPPPTFTVQEGRILDIEQRTPERNKHSLGITAGINMEYQFARNFFLLIEPTFKYYVKAIEENSSRGDKQPYSIGLRAGIWYRLNLKNKTR